MVYNGGYVVCVLKDGEPLENTDSPGIVKLPYGQQYGIRLRNKNPVDCQASVHIDGQFIGTFVISGNNFGDIYRPVDRDTAFIFAHKHSNESKRQGKDKTLKNDTGRIEVVFAPRKQVPVSFYPPPYGGKITTPSPIEPWINPKPNPWKKPYPPYPPYKNPWEDEKTTITWNAASTDANSSYRSPTKDGYLDFDGEEPCIAKSILPSLGIKQDEGVTVDGAATGQYYHAVTFIPDLTQTKRLVIRLKGYIDEQRPETYCSQCGVKRKKSAKFCDQCGRKF